MANTIEVYTGFDEKTNTHHSTTFEIVDFLPMQGSKLQYGTVKNIDKVEIECGQDSDTAFNYDYYEATIVTSKKKAPVKTETKYFAINNEAPNLLACVAHFDDFIPPTAKDASIILSEYFNKNTQYLLGEELRSAIKRDNDKDYTEDQLFSRYFGISDELYEKGALCGLGISKYYISPYPADIENAYISDRIKGFMITADISGVYIYAHVPYWWKDIATTVRSPYKWRSRKELLNIKRDDLDESIMNKLPDRHISDIHPEVMRVMLEISENVGDDWIDRKEDKPDTIVSWSWKGLISLKFDEYIKFANCIKDIITMPFKDFVEKCGYTRTSFAKRFQIPEKTVNEWMYGKSKVKPYIRLMLAEICHLYD